MTRVLVVERQDGARARTLRIDEAFSDMDVIYPDLEDEWRNLAYG